MPSSTSDRRRTRTLLLVPALVVVLALAGYLAHPSLRLTGAETARSPGSGVASSPAPGGPGGDPPEAALPAGALTVGTAVDAAASPQVVAAALYDAYAAAVQVVPTSCHLPVSLLAALGQAESGALVDVAAGRAALTAVAARTARSLCAGDRDLARPSDLRAALLDRVASPAFVRLVLTLEARYAGMGLGLLAVTGPVLVPLLVAAATARPMAPYAPVAAVFAPLVAPSPGFGAGPARPHQQPPMIPASASPTPTLTAASTSTSPSLTPGVAEPAPVAPSAGSGTGPGAGQEDGAGQEVGAEPEVEAGAATDATAGTDTPSPSSSTEPAAEAPPDPVDTPTTSDPAPVCTQDPTTDPSPSPSDPTPLDPASSDPASASPDPGTETDPATGDCAPATTDGSAGAGGTAAEQPTQEPDPSSPPPETVLP